jgi:hypothetical protein
LTLVSILPTVFGCLYQWKGIGFIGPLYYFIHYIQTPQENYLAADNLMVPIADAKVIIPTIGIGYLAPTIAMFLHFPVESRQLLNGIWQTFPIWTAVLHSSFKSLVTDTAPEDRKWAPTRGVSWLRYAYAFGGLVSATAYTYLRFTSPFPLHEVFFNGISSPFTPVVSLSDGCARFLKYNQIVAFGSGLFWEALHFRDLKKAGKMEAGWVKVLGILGGMTLLFGPGAAMALGWAWREELMAAYGTRRAENAGKAAE